MGEHSSNDHSQLSWRVAVPTFRLGNSLTSINQRCPHVWMIGPCVSFDLQMHAWRYVCNYACMYLCMYIIVCVIICVCMDVWMYAGWIRVCTSYTHHAEGKAPSIRYTFGVFDASRHETQPKASHPCDPATATKLVVLNPSFDMSGIPIWSPAK